MNTLIILAGLVLVIGITSLGIVLFGKDGKALKALGAICFVTFTVVLVGGCMSMPDAGYVNLYFDFEQQSVFDTVITLTCIGNNQV